MIDRIRPLAAAPAAFSSPTLALILLLLLLHPGLWAASQSGSCKASGHQAACSGCSGASPEDGTAHGGCAGGEGAEADARNAAGQQHLAPGGKRGQVGRGGHHAVMQNAMRLVHDFRDSIERQVVELDNGIVTTTISASNPEAAKTLARHVAEMKSLLESGGRVRGWDPLFREIFDHYSEIDMQVEAIPGGVRVTETSENPEVAKLIKAHAQKVNEFLARGPAAVHESTPLPSDYRP